MTTDREQLLGDRIIQPPPTQYGSNEISSYGDAAARLMQQQSVLRQQTHDLDRLSGGVTTVRSVAGQIHNEVNDQLQILDGLERGVDRTIDGVGHAQRNVVGTSETPYNFRNYCLLLWPLVLLFILIGEAIIHFFHDVLFG